MSQFLKKKKKSLPLLKKKEMRGIVGQERVYQGQGREECVTRARGQDLLFLKQFSLGMREGA